MIFLKKNFLATSSYDRTIKIWDYGDQYDLKLVSVIAEHKDEVYQLAYSKKHNLLASSSYDQSVKVYREFKEWKVLFTLKGHNAKTWALEFIDNIDRLLSGGSDKKIFIWNVYNGNLVCQLLGHQDTVWSMLYIYTLHSLVSGDNRYIKVWSVNDFYMTTKSIDIQAHMDRIYSLIDLPTQKAIASGSLDRTVKIWSQNSFQLLSVIEEAGQITCLRYIPFLELVAVSVMQSESQGYISFQKIGSDEFDKEIPVVVEGSNITKFIWNQSDQVMLIAELGGIIQIQ